MVEKFGVNNPYHPSTLPYTSFFYVSSKYPKYSVPLAFAWQTKVRKVWRWAKDALDGPFDSFPASDDSYKANEGTQQQFPQ